MNITIFPNGEVHTSTALTVADMDSAFQMLTTQMLGIAANLHLQCELEDGTNVLKTPLVTVNLALGFFVVGVGIVPGSVIVDLAGLGTDLLITINNPVTGNAIETVSFFDPVSNTKVRPAWQTEGMPAFGINDDVVFFRATEDITEYSEIRNEAIEESDSGEAIRHRTYSRLWNVFFRARGPNSFDTIRLIKSMLLEDFAHDSLATLQLYLTSIMGTPNRVPELFEGRWWEQVDFSVQFMEQVDERMTVPIIASVPVIGDIDIGQAFNITVQK